MSRALRAVPGSPRWRRARRAARRHRRLLAAALVGAAVLVGLPVLRPPPAPSVAVLVAARGISGGTALRAGDLTSVRLPPEAVPDGALAADEELSGRRVAGPLARGEPLTAARLVGPALVAGYGRSLVAAPVRVADPGAVGLLRAGDRVDVLAAAVDAGGDRGEAATVVARDAPVAVVPAPDEGGGAAVDGALVVLAVPAGTAAVLAAQAVRARLSIVVLP